MVIFNKDFTKEDFEKITEDRTFLNAVDLALSFGKVSTSLLQRKLAIGYGKAAKYLDLMEELGIITPFCNHKAREVIITPEQWHKLITSGSPMADDENKSDAVAVILLADGFEEIEALTPLDVLRRAGINVKTVAVSNKIAVGAHGIPVVCDMTEDEVNYDKLTAVIFPGGMPGALNLDSSPISDKMITAVSKNDGIIAAICAAPLVLGRRGVLEGKHATCYPGFEKELIGADCRGEGVVTDGNIVTARGMGVALEFSLKLTELLVDKATATKISEGICERSIYGAEVSQP